jgi:SAM-dependent methyltransferase
MRCETAEALADGRLISPSAERNKEPIAQVLMRVLPAEGDVLEVGSGTGQHILHFARAMPHLRWQPTERDANCLTSIERWLAADALPNVVPPVRLDVHDEVWPVSDATAVVCINMIHIAPPSATEALLRGASRVLSAGGILALYGPYRRQGRHISSGNEAFDQKLRAENVDWGVRNLEDVALSADAVGLELQEIVEMPANNLTVVLRRR